jgi:hypothetical protein
MSNLSTSSSFTDGQATDDVESVILSAARKLDKWDALAWQVGI